jgi:hypothetical protein
MSPRESGGPPDVPVLMKPLHPGAVLTCLLDEIRKARQTDPQRAPRQLVH